MKKYPEEKEIQRLGAEYIYDALKDEIPAFINMKMKKKIVSMLINALFCHKDDTIMLRYGCFGLLVFFQFDTKALIFDFKRLIQILLYMMSKHGSNEHNYLLRLGVLLLNTLACEVEKNQKLMFGDLGAIEELLSIIKEKLNSKTCDEVLKTAWSTMWNVTDETPINCERFLNGQGMELFLKCKEEFPESNSLLRNMMGLLGNVAEVPHLRPKLMTEAFVSEFALLLDSSLDGIEVSYNAAGVLAHMAADGPDAWTIEEPTREDVLERMVKAIDRWELDTQRSINYRSFEPILRLVRVGHTFQCQHWAVWALANLTTVDNEKYCSLIEKEGGLQLLDQLINGKISQFPNQKVIECASIVRNNISKWNERRKTNEMIKNEIIRMNEMLEENNEN